ncbi:hypothetical protein LIN78_05040 [Leeia sp. TBRC 13508]|uniref:Transmembrane protein n=1 Tax=Leeia speluncae TaxID=2884804 RepID=A0ABS8D5M0_9NEIS|nr:hypothetical protein [Leeia speluncae]MCB6182913.1 hypothetical protein [Leeia speluncae]
MNPIWRWLKLAGIAGLVIGYMSLAYLASASDRPPLIAFFVGVTPFALGVLGFSWKTKLRYPVLMAFGALAVWFWQETDWFLKHSVWLYLAQYLFAMFSLALMFGSTLGSPANALCSKIAALAKSEPLTERYLRYTWKVTLVWTVYFVVAGCSSLLLFLTVPAPKWAIFDAIAAPVSLGLMFAGEYWIRLRTFPDESHISIQRTVELYREFSQSHKRGSS